MVLNLERQKKPAEKHLVGRKVWIYEMTDFEISFQRKQRDCWRLYSPPPTCTKLHMPPKDYTLGETGVSTKEQHVRKTTKTDCVVTELLYWYCWVIKWDLKSDCLRATLRAGHSSLTTKYRGKISSLLGESHALTPNKTTFASHLPDKFCYSLGVYKDRKQVVNVPFKLLIALWKQNMETDIVKLRKGLWCFKWVRRRGEVRGRMHLPSSQSSKKATSTAACQALQVAGVANNHCAYRLIPIAKAAARGQQLLTALPGRGL